MTLVPSVSAVDDQHFSMPSAADGRLYIDGKFFRRNGELFLLKGVAYGTFAPDPDARQFPSPDRVACDFDIMARAGVNMVRTYTPPTPPLLDEAAQHGLFVMAALPWAQHVAFLDDRALC